MRHLLIAAISITALSGAAYAEGTASKSTTAPARTLSKPTPAKAAKSAKKQPVIPDTSTASAPHRYPRSARILPPARPLASSASSQAGTVHKDAPLDQIAGTGG